MGKVYESVDNSVVLRITNKAKDFPREYDYEFIALSPKLVWSAED